MTIRSYQAITTKYLPATNVRGSRIKATASAGSVIVSYNDALNTEDAHTEAAVKLARKFGWVGEWHIGGLPDNRGYVFVCADADNGPAFKYSIEKAA